MKPKKIAIVAEWLTWRGGGETVLDALLDTFPGAKLFTTVYNKEKLPEYKKFKPTTSFLQRVPLVNKKHQLIPPLLLKAIESLDLDGFDLIISLSSAIGKGIKKPQGSTHICYCHTPMRYVWQPKIDNRLTKIPFGKCFINYLKKWDLKSNEGVDYFIANSGNTAGKIKKFYNRQSSIIYPPVKCVEPRQAAKNEFFLCLGRLVSYKRLDLAIRAFNDLGKKLVIAGDGPEMTRLKKLAGKNIEFLGRVGEKEKTELLSRAKALVFPAEEDFGIVPIEAMSQGTPVIAFNKGGAKETVIAEKTGVLFENQTPEDLKEAVIRFEKSTFKREEMIERSKAFSLEKFKKEIISFINKI